MIAGIVVTVQNKNHPKFQSDFERLLIVFVRARKRFRDESSSNLSGIITSLSSKWSTCLIVALS